MTVSPTTDNRAALARRLKSLRQHRWPGETVPQRMLAEAFGSEKPLSLSLISAWENDKNPTAPQPARLHDYATFFVTKRSIAAGRGRLIPDEELTADEIAARDELYRSLLSLAAEATDLSAATAETPIRFDWRFPDGGNVRIVCGKLDDRYGMHPYADPNHPNYTDLLTFADSDALIELFGHVRKTNPDNDIRFIRSDQLEVMAASPDEVTSHLILVGGIGLNTLWTETQMLNRVAMNLPIRQIPITSSKFAEWGDDFEVTEGDDKRAVRAQYVGTDAPTQGQRAAVTEDVGLLARMSNPFNSSTTLTICSGVFASGVVGAVRILTDEILRRQNESYLASRFRGSQRWAILMRVPMVLGAAMTPDLQIAPTRLFEWSDNEIPGNTRGLERAG